MFKCLCACIPLCALNENKEINNNIQHREWKHGVCYGVIKLFLGYILFNANKSILEIFEENTSQMTQD